MSLVTTSKQDMDVRRALNAGGCSLCFEEHPKSRDAALVIRWVAEGRRHIPSEAASTIAEHPGQEEPSPREI